MFVDRYAYSTSALFTWFCSSNSPVILFGASSFCVCSIPWLSISKDKYSYRKFIGAHASLGSGAINTVGLHITRYTINTD